MQRPKLVDMKITVKNRIWKATLVVIIILFFNGSFSFSQSLYDPFDDCSPWATYDQIVTMFGQGYQSSTGNYCGSGRLHLSSSYSDPTCSGCSGVLTDGYAYRSYSFKSGHSYRIHLGGVAVSNSPGISLFAANGKTSNPSNLTFNNQTFITYSIMSNGDFDGVFLPTQDLSTFGIGSVPNIHNVLCNISFDFIQIIDETCSVTIRNSSSLNICKTGVTTLTANAGSGATYSWTQPDGGCCYSGTNQSITVYDAGIFKVTANIPGCTALASASVTTYISGTNCSAAARVSSGNPIVHPNENIDSPTVMETSAYPNPATDKVTVALPWTAKEDAPVLLYDMFGKVMASTILKKGEWKTDLSVINCVDGLYVVKVGNGDLINAVKVMVVHK